MSCTHQLWQDNFDASKQQVITKQIVVSMPWDVQMSLAFNEPIEKFVVQTSTLTPRMHQELTEHGKFHMKKKSTPDQNSSWIKRITLTDEPSVFLRKVVKGLAYRQCQLYFAHPSTRCLGPNQQSPPHHKMPKQFRKVKTSYHTSLEIDIDR